MNKKKVKNKAATKFLLFLSVIIIFFLILFFYISNKTSYSVFENKNIHSIPDSVLFNSAPVLTPQQALQKFSLVEGFKIELVASEPLIHDPVAMAFDEDGRIWVVEMQSFMPDVEGSNEEQKINRIVILEDTNGDGEMDLSKVFLDSLVLPRAISIVSGGILYAEPPNLWYVENVGDKPGKKILVDSAYARAGNPEHQANGLMRGIDNWIYNAKSASRYSYQQQQWIKEETEYRGQWGITMDNYGRLFYNTNSNQLLGDLVPPNSLDKHPDFTPSFGINIQIAENQQVFPIRPTPGINRGYIEDMLDEKNRLEEFTAACGPLIYRGDQFPEEYEGNAFVCEPAGNLIKRNIIFEDAPYLQAEQAYEDYEFLASTDERFRPVNLYNGPDGSLYILDMYRGIIQHKYFITDYLREQIASRDLAKPTGYGRIYKVVYEGNWWNRFLKSSKEDSSPALSRASDKELVSHLAHKNGWWRDNAQRLLVERNNKAIAPEIMKVIRQEKYKNYNQLHALWTLEGMGIDDPAIFKDAIQEGQTPKVVATAVRIAEKFSHGKEVAEILGLYEQALKHKNVLVQLQVALSLEKFMEADPVRVLEMLQLIAMENGQDPLFREAIISSLNGKEDDFLVLFKETEATTSDFISFLEEIAEKNKIRSKLQEKDFSAAVKEHYIAGKSLYESVCAGCHGINGEGIFRIAPPLVNSEWVTGSKDRLILLVLNGMKGPVIVNGKLYKEPEVQEVMPGFKDNPELTDKKLANILTYIRNAWNNEADPVTPSTVKDLREKSIDRREPYTAKELLHNYL